MNDASTLDLITKILSGAAAGACAVLFWLIRALYASLQERVTMIETELKEQREELKAFRSNYLSRFEGVIRQVNEGTIETIGAINELKVQLTELHGSIKSITCRSCDEK